MCRESPIDAVTDGKFRGRVEIGREYINFLILDIYIHISYFLPSNSADPSGQSDSISASLGASGNLCSNPGFMGFLLQGI